MSDQAGFIQAICERPADDMARLIYADWFSSINQYNYKAGKRGAINTSPPLPKPPPGLEVRVMAEEQSTFDFSPPQPNDKAARQKIRMAAWRAKNKDRTRAYMDVWRQDNRPHIMQYGVEWFPDAPIRNLQLTNGMGQEVFLFANGGLIALMIL